MAFYEIQFPPGVSLGFIGGPRFNTTVIPSGSGFEKRSIRWSSSRAEYDYTHLLKEPDDRDAIISFFYIAEGRAHGFRVKDWTDFKVVQGPLLPLVGGAYDPDAAATGDDVTTAFQIVKRYSTGGVNYTRLISKPVPVASHSGLNPLVQNGVTFAVRIDSVAVDPADYSLDTTTGIVTFDTAPGDGLSVDVTCEFDVPVRFDSDRLEVMQERFDLATLPGRMVELKIPVPTA